MEQSDDPELWRLVDAYLDWEERLRQTALALHVRLETVIRTRTEARRRSLSSLRGTPWAS